MSAVAAQPTGGRPNFLIILTDDMGYTDLGAFGGAEIPTPNLDRLAWDGVRLTNFHAAPSCAPTRAILMSGTGNHEAGLGTQLFYEVFAGEYGYERFLQPRVATMPEVLQANGYHTMMAGKWHIGEGDPSGGTLPGDFGFDRDFTLLRGADSHYGYAYKDSMYSEDGARLDTMPEPVYSTIRYTDKLLGFLDDYAGSESPFFAVYAPTAPHWPLQYPPGWEHRFDGAFDAGFDQLCRKRMAGALSQAVLPANADIQSCSKESGPWDALSADEQRAFAKVMEVYAAMVAHLDEEIGRILDYMDTRGMLDNTWIIFMNDNGPQGGPLSIQLVGNRAESPVDNSVDNLGNPDSWASIGQGWADAISSPYRNTKASQFEGGIRVPAFFWHREAISPGRIDNQFLTAMDIMPTVLDLAGIDPPAGKFRGRDILPIRGRSLAPLLASDNATIHAADEGIALDSAGNRMMVKGHWKIVQQRRSEWLLFNLAEDPGERRDLSSEMPERRAAMVEEFNRFAGQRNYIEFQ